MSPVIDDDVEVPACFLDEFIEEYYVSLVSGEDGHAGGLVGPCRGAGGVVFDVV